MNCSVYGCHDRVRARTLCSYHYHWAYRTVGTSAMPGGVFPDTWINPLVCVCAVPDADPRIDFGECKQCRRKPLALFAAAL